VEGSHWIEVSPLPIGIALTKAKGIYKGRKPALNAERIA
jgi:hypothetical protein